MWRAAQCSEGILCDEIAFQYILCDRTNVLPIFLRVALLVCPQTLTFHDDGEKRYEGVWCWDIVHGKTGFYEFLLNRTTTKKLQTFSSFCRNCLGIRGLKSAINHLLPFLWVYQDEASFGYQNENEKT